MLIGVVSDTHLKKHDTRFYHLVKHYFHSCNMLLHAGDIVDPEIFEGVEINIFAVKGNMDLGVDLPYKRVIEIGSFKIGLIHGYGAPHGIEQRILKEFEGEKIDCVVFGHTHKSYVGEFEGIKLFNPGSPFDNRYGSKKSVGFIDVNGEEIKFRIEEIYYD